MIRGARANTHGWTGRLLGLMLLLVLVAGCSGLPNAPLASRPRHGTNTASIVDGKPQGVVMMLRTGADPDQVAMDHGGTVVGSGSATANVNDTTTDATVNLTASTQTEVEFRRLPTAGGVSAASAPRPGRAREAVTPPPAR